jgi:2-methylcitrate dehydratase PrpD
MTAVVLGYQAHCQFTDAFPIAEPWKFDNVTYGSFSAPIIAGKFFGLTEDQMMNVIGISGCHNLTMAKAVKSGSMMKALG